MLRFLQVFYRPCPICELLKANSAHVRATYVCSGLGFNPVLGPFMASSSGVREENSCASSALYGLACRVRKVTLRDRDQLVCFHLGCHFLEVYFEELRPERNFPNPILKRVEFLKDIG